LKYATYVHKKEAPLFEKGGGEERNGNIMEGVNLLQVHMYRIRRIKLPS
jgi:hypothetical protein